MPSPRWLFTITPTSQGLTNHPNWKQVPGPIAVYDRADLERRIRAAHAALAVGDITAFHAEPVDDTDWWTGPDQPPSRGHGLSAVLVGLTLLGIVTAVLIATGLLHLHG